MSRTGKIVLGGIVTLTCLCLCSVLVLFPLGLVGHIINRNMVTDSSDIARVARGIAEYRLPTGYGQDFAVSLVGMSLVCYSSATGDGHIMLMQLPRHMKLDAATMERQLWSLVSGQRSRVAFNLHTVDKLQVAIRGQQVTLDVSEGTVSSGTSYRQVAGQFDGEGGQTFLLVGAPVSEWDPQAFDEFIGSVR